MTVTSLPTPVGRQKEVLFLPHQGHVVVLGTAGSGKTTLAILRSLYLSDQSTSHAGRTLLVTFNRCLVTYMERLMSDTNQKSVDVRNYHHFARGYLGFRNKLPWGCISTNNQRSQDINNALSEMRAECIESSVLDRSVQFIDEELQWIQQHGIVDEASYVSGSRTGRVERPDRPVLFDLYQRYLAYRKQRGKLYDWVDLASAVRRELQSDREERYYRHVVIDEGQDFSPEMLRSLAIAVPADGSLTFFGDIAQQIYGHRMSWRSAGLSAHRIWQFRENYRNTKQIAQLALAVAKMPQFPNDADLVEPNSPPADGPLPAKVRFPSESAELAWVVDQAQRLARAGTVAVLFRTRQALAALQNSGATRLHGDLDEWPTGPGLFYGTYHAAKGLEFDTVFLPMLSHSRWDYPPDMDEIGEQQDAVSRDARLLYVGITRARTDLILTYTDRLTTLLPEQPELYQE